MENKVNDLSYLKWKTELAFAGFGASRFCTIYQESLTGGKPKSFPGERRYNKLINKIKNRIRIRNIILNIIIKTTITLIQIPVFLILTALPVYLTHIPELGYLTGSAGGCGIVIVGIFTYEADLLETNSYYITFKHKNKIHGK